MVYVVNRTLTTFLILLVVANCVSAFADDQDRKVTSADMPRILPTGATDAIATFKLAAGFQIELVASEPLVSDPVDACFDEFGRMFVAEMHGYPFSFEPTRLNPAGGGKANAGIIRLLEDTDGDGGMDKSSIFADGISWPTSVCCYNGGIFVIAPGYLYYMKDTNNDGKADIKDIILSGFGRDNVQAVTNGLRWGTDNFIYFAAGRNPRQLMHRGKPLSGFGSNDIRFDPRTETFEVVTGGVQFGHTVDDWGTRFVCSNSDHVVQIIYPQHYLARNRFLVPTGLVKSIATDGASAPVYRISPPEPWRIIRQKWRAAEKGYRLEFNETGGWEFIPLDASKPAGVVPTEYPEGFFTSATGVTIYRGDAYPQQFSGNLFVGDVGGNLIHRKTLQTDNVTYSASRADIGEEIVASTDNWFRPVNFVNAPDGSLFVLDMYRETIEHPFSIPEQIKAFLDMYSGFDRGRIYRLVSPGMQRRPVTSFGRLNDAEIVQQLASSNGWNRDTAQRLIWERQDVAFVDLIDKLLTTDISPQAKIHALNSLDGLNVIRASHLRRALKDEHPRVRSHAVRLAEKSLRESDQLLGDLLPLVNDMSEHVRFQLAFSLGESNNADVVEALAILARNPDNGLNVQTAVLSSSSKIMGQLFAALIKDDVAVQQSHVQSLLSQLGIMIGSNPDVPDSYVLLEALNQSQPYAVRANALTALCAGLERRSSNLTELLQSAAIPQTVRESVDSLFSVAAAEATNDRLPDDQRIAGIRLLAFANYETASSRLLPLLSPRSSQTLQRAVVSAIGRQSGPSVARELLGHWSALSPLVRSELLDELLSSEARCGQLLTAIEEANVKVSEIGASHRSQLLKHRSSAIRKRSELLWGDEVETNRSQVVTQFQDVLALMGDPANGRTVFTRTCSVCHKVGEIGYQVAPDLASVKNKSTADLLISILDPNRETQPNFNAYNVITVQGRNHNGIISSETSNSVTLRKAEAKEDVVLRDNIDEMTATGISLMPEGLEKDLSRQQIADVIAFIKSI